MNKGDTTSKRNQIFCYLYVVAIIMVIDDHCSTRIGFLSSVFPYNSFYMPLFVFISGYFYKRQAIHKNIGHKIKKLFIPYAIWNVIAALAALMIDRVIGVDWIKMPSAKSIEVFFIHGSLTSINGAAWFIIMLFWVSIFINAIYYAIGKENILKDIIMGIILLVMGAFSVFLCTKGYYKRGLLWVFVLKSVFYMQFYFLGYLFKKYFEELIRRCKKIIVCTICVLVNIILIVFFGGSINFYSTSGMSSFSYWFLPIITSMTGILFYYEIMYFLSSKIGYNKYIDFVSRNTLTIMETHLLFVNIPNLYIYSAIKRGSTKFSNFNMAAVHNGAWYRYSDNSRLMAFLCGLVGSLLVAYLVECIQKNIKKRRTKKLN